MQLIYVEFEYGTIRELMREESEISARGVLNVGGIALYNTFADSD